MKKDKALQSCSSSDWSKLGVHVLRLAGEHIVGHRVDVY